VECINASKIGRLKCDRFLLFWWEHDIKISAREFMSKEIDNLIEQLSWNGTEERQRHAIDALVELVPHSELYKLMRPGKAKDTWENAAEVIARYNRKFGQKEILGMFEWLQDINWPGASLIFKKLNSMSRHQISAPLEMAMCQAQRTNDQEWMEQLVKIRENNQL
jgi:hypothetical protein